MNGDNFVAPPGGWAEREFSLLVRAPDPVQNNKGCFLFFSNISSNICKTKSLRVYFLPKNGVAL